jgi:hypothetical protein
MQQEFDINNTNQPKWATSLREKEFLWSIVDTSTNCIIGRERWAKCLSLPMSAIKIPIIPVISTAVCFPPAQPNKNLKETTGESQHYYS